jgi:putative transposase
MIKVGTSQNLGLYIVVNFCDLETKTEYRLATNLPTDGKAVVTNEELMKMYRARG